MNTATRPMSAYRAAPLSGLTPKVGAMIAALRTVLSPRPDPVRLPDRLRRDAGLDEIELERETAARAPLIRTDIPVARGLSCRCR